MRQALILRALNLVRFGKESGVAKGHSASPKRSARPSSLENLLPPGRPSPSNVTHVKIYGERNTGTGFTKDLFRRNFRLALFGAAPERVEPAKLHDIVKQMRDYDWLVKRIVYDRFTAQANRKHMRATLGWKHMHPPLDFLATVPDVLSSTLFVVTVKHPVYWALSFYKHPYHSYFQMKGLSFSEFIRHIFIPTSRDNVEAPYYPSIVDLYAEKIDGYRKLSELAPFFELVRYEVLLGSVPEFLKLLETKYGLSRRPGRERIRQESTKKNVEMTFADFQSKYQLDKIAQAVSAPDYDFILSRFGKDRLAWLGYPID